MVNYGDQRFNYCPHLGRYHLEYWFSLLPRLQTCRRWVPELHDFRKKI